MAKIKVVVLYGGKSGEHEVSLQSAASVLRNLDPQRYEVIPVGIDKEGHWHLNDLQLLQDQTARALPIFKDQPEVLLPPATGKRENALFDLSGKKARAIDVVFPVMHGSFSEDGTIQGLLELADVPYVGAGVLGSSVGMDKDVSKRLARDAGLPVAPYLAFRKDAWLQKPLDVKKQIQSSLRFPVFIKPSNAGSSVGVVKVKAASELDAAIREAFRWDVKILAEQGVVAREIELSVLENIDSELDPLCSVPGEISPTHEFYSYDAKYMDQNGAKLEIPAQLTEEQVQEAKTLAQRLFIALETQGMARVDLFLEKETGKFFFNEINTIPGFTSISMYPKLWEASGMKYRDLLDRLIQLALHRHQRKNELSRDWTSKA